MIHHVSRERRTSYVLNPRPLSACITCQRFTPTPLASRPIRDKYNHALDSRNPTWTTEKITDISELSKSLPDHCHVWVHFWSMLPHTHFSVIVSTSERVCPVENYMGISMEFANAGMCHGIPPLKGGTRNVLQPYSSFSSVFLADFWSVVLTVP